MAKEEVTSKSIFDSKVVILCDRLIYPRPLRELVACYKKGGGLNLFVKDSYVRVISVCDFDEDRLQQNSEDPFHAIWKDIEAIKTIVIDVDELDREMKDIREKIDNGVNEYRFHNWFMKLAFHLSQLKHPLDEDNQVKERYAPRARIVSQFYPSGLHVNHLFFSSEGRLLDEPYLSEWEQKVNTIIKDALNKKPRNGKKRSPIDSHLRHEVFKRDGYRCVECGVTNKDATLLMDQDGLAFNHVLCMG